jgi:hypothetical protein
MGLLKLTGLLLQTEMENLLAQFLFTGREFSRR